MILTKPRKLILELMQQDQENLLSTEMIYEKVKHEKVNLSTVYRTMDLFLNEGIVGKSVMGQVTYYYYEGHKHHHYMICTNCKKMLPMDCVVNSFIQDVSKKAGFEVTQHDLTVYGLCKECHE